MDLPLPQSPPLDAPPPPPPPRTDFPVTLVPRLRELNQGMPALSLQLDRADVPFQGEASKSQALVRLLRRLQAARHSESGRRVQAWESQYAASIDRRRDYSLVSLLTSTSLTLDGPGHEQPAAPVPGGSGGGSQPNTEGESSLAIPGGERRVDSPIPTSGLVQRLVAADAAAGGRDGGGAGSGGRLAAAPLRAQAELLARLRPVIRADGELILAAGTLPTSIFFIRSGSVAVTMAGEEVLPGRSADPLTARTPKPTHLHQRLSRQFWWPVKS